MFETISHSPVQATTLLRPQRPVHPSAQPTYYGPERRSGGREPGAWLTRMLDEIDYGMLLVTADAQVTYLNHAGRLELDGHHPLQLLGRTLKVNRPQDVAPLYDALAAAQRGLRKLVTVGEGEHRVSISVVPLPNDDADAGPLTLLVLGKRQMCEQLSVQGFARSVNLTPAETRVLEHLCAGVRPTEIAQRQSVAVSTVRTQIGSIRAKTGAASIRELVRQVAVLPPLVGALRNGAMGAMGAMGGLAPWAGGRSGPDTAALSS